MKVYSVRKAKRRRARRAAANSGKRSRLSTGHPKRKGHAALIKERKRSPRMNTRVKATGVKARVRTHGLKLSKQTRTRSTPRTHGKSVVQQVSSSTGPGKRSLKLNKQMRSSRPRPVHDKSLEKQTRTKSSIGRAKLSLKRLVRG